MSSWSGEKNPWDTKRNGSANDLRRRQEIEERIIARKPLRVADKTYLREALGLTMWMRNGKDVLA